jgi:hypothetical protein
MRAATDPIGMTTPEEVYGEPIYYNDRRLRLEG